MKRQNAQEGFISVKKRSIIVKTVRIIRQNRLMMSKIMNAYVLEYEVNLNLLLKNLNKLCAKRE